MAKSLAVNLFSFRSKRVLINSAKACIKALFPVNSPSVYTPDEGVYAQDL